MKFLNNLTIFVVCAICVLNTEAKLAQSVMLLVRPKLLQCAKDGNVSQKDLNAVINDDLSNQSMQMQCLALCFFHSLGMMDSQGNVRPLVSKLLFSAGEFPCVVNRVVNKCKNVKGTSPCNTAYLLNACYVREGLL